MRNFIKSRWASTQNLKQIDPYLRTLYIFNVLSLVGGTVYGLYYGIFLYRQTFSLSVLATDGLLGAFGTWLGYVLGIVIIKKFGYKHCLKAAFGLAALVAFATALIVGHIAQWFMVLGVIRALPAGLDSAAVDTLVLREVKKDSRNNFLQLVLGFEFIASVALPVVLGAAVGWAGGYRLTFAVAGLVYLAALLVPIRLPRPEVSFSLKEVLATFQRPLYKAHAGNRTTAAGFNQINGFVTMIIPFLMLKSELKMGLLTSAVALVAGCAAFLMKRVDSRKKLAIGYGAHGLRALSNLAFVMSWSAPFLLLWQMISKLSSPLQDPLQQGLDIHNDSLVMGEDVRRQALQINVLNNTLTLVGTTAAYGVFFLIVRAAAHGQRSILATLILSYAGWRFINLTVSYLINRRAQGLAWPAINLGQPVWSFFRPANRSVPILPD